MAQQWRRVLGGAGGAGRAGRPQRSQPAGSQRPKRRPAAPGWPRCMSGSPAAKVCTGASADTRPSRAARSSWCSPSSSASSAGAPLLLPSLPLPSCSPGAAASGLLAALSNTAASGFLAAPGWRPAGRSGGSTPPAATQGWAMTWARLNRAAGSCSRRVGQEELQVRPGVGPRGAGARRVRFAGRSGAAKGVTPTTPQHTTHHPPHLRSALAQAPHLLQHAQQQLLQRLGGRHLGREPHRLGLHHLEQRHDRVGTAWVE